MYLSKCLITSSRPLNPYEIHRKIWTLFPKRPTATRDFLFRVEKKSPAAHSILLQSAKIPTATTSEVVVLDQKEVDYSFSREMGLRFLISANPTKRIRDYKGKKQNQGRCRVPLIDEDEIRNWLIRKFVDAAQLQEIVISRKDTLYFRKKGRPGKIVMVTFNGLLIIENEEIFKGLVTNGIGPAKAFGCGLLSLARC